MYLRRTIREHTSSLFPNYAKLHDLVSKGWFQEALVFYKHQIHASGKNDDRVLLLPSVVKASSSSVDFLPFGLQMHGLCYKTGMVSDIVVANSLLSMYAKYLFVDLSRQLFESMTHRDVVTWSSMITNYIQNGCLMEAIDMFKRMVKLGFKPKAELLAAIVCVCNRAGKLLLGKAIHGWIISNPVYEESVYLLTALLDMYSKYGDLSSALRLFNQMPNRNEVSWTCMIAGCSMNQRYDMSFELFRQMQMAGIKPNRVTLFTVLLSCREMGSFRYGRQIHGFVIRCGLELDGQVNISLIDVYYKCGATDIGLAIFKTAKKKDVIMWSSMIRNCSRNGDYMRAIDFFNQMQRENIKPNSVTILAVLKAFTDLSSLCHGAGVHGYIVKLSCNTNVFIGNSLIDMYMKCGCLEDANQVFNQMPLKDSTSWSCIISGYGLHGHGTMAILLFHKMLQQGLQVDSLTLLSVLSACKFAGLAEEARKLFSSFIRDHKNSLKIQHYACYVDLIARSRGFEEACEVINAMPMQPNPSIWSCVISACIFQGRFDIARALTSSLIDSEPENAANYIQFAMIQAKTGNWSERDVRGIMKNKGLRKTCGHSRTDAFLSA